MQEIRSNKMHFVIVIVQSTIDLKKEFRLVNMTIISTYVLLVSNTRKLRFSINVM